MAPSEILHLIVLSRIGKVFAFKWLYKNEEFVRCFKTLTWAGGRLSAAFLFYISHRIGP